MWSEYSTEELNAFQKAMMGPGYTEFCMPHDGDPYLHHAIAHLENGDMLILAVWLWANK